MHPNYGSNSPSTPPQSALAPRKEPFFSLIASFFIPGLGTILNGETRKGVTFMAVFYVSPFVGMMIGLYFVSALFGAGLLVSLGAWIWGLIDAYKGAEAHNARHGLH